MILENCNLEPHNTFATPAKARWLITLNQPQFSEEEKYLVQNNKHLVLGEGSNTLFIKDYEGVVIKNEIKGKEIISQDKDTVTIKVGAGENWDDLVAWTLQQGFYGLENLSLIPGTVGAAPVQNIGAYGKEVSEHITNVEGFFISTSEIKSFGKSDCNFSYRNSIFKSKLHNNFLITQVAFELSLLPEVEISYKTLQQELLDRNIADPTPEDVRQAVISVRQSRLPDWKKIPNAGSFFKNPTIAKERYFELIKNFPDMPSYPIDENHKKLPAAWLIDQAGWKGVWQGNVGTHDTQPLVIVTNGKASGLEIVAFSKKIQASIQDRFGILLEPEVNIIGV